MMSRLTFPTLSLALLTFLAGSLCLQAQQYWDGGDTTGTSGVIVGGTGNWNGDNTTTNWTTSTGSGTTFWGDGNGTGTSTAVFTVAHNLTGTYSVTIDGIGANNLNAPGLTFNVGGYNLIYTAGNGGGLLLTGTNPTINTVEGATTISAPLGSTGTVIKSGNGQLILSGDNTTPIFNNSVVYSLTGLTLNAGSLVSVIVTGSTIGNTFGGPSALLTLQGGTGLQNYLQLTSANTSPVVYGNNVDINGNVLIINDVSTLTGSSVVTNSFGTLLLNGTLYNQNNSFNGTSNVTNLSFGATTLTGTTTAIISQTYANTNLVTLASVDGSASNTNLIVGGNGNTTITGTTNLGSGNLIKFNSGTLTLGGTFTTTGSLVIMQETAGNVILAATTNVQNILVNGGSLTLGTTASGTTNWISDTATVTLAGGNLIASTLATGASQQEVIGTLSIGTGFSRISSVGGTAGAQTIVLGGLGSRATGGTIDFVVTGTGNGNVQFATSQTGSLANGILGGWATTGDNFATVSASGTSVVAYAAYLTGTTDFSGTANSSSNVKLAVTTGSDIVLGQDSTINSLNEADSTASGTTTLDLGGNTLTLVSGGIIGAGSTANRPTYNILDGSLTAGTSDATSELFYTANSAQNVNLGATITDNGSGGSVSFVEDGVGALNLFLSSANTYTGKTYLEDGTTNILTDRQLGVEPTSFQADNITLSNGATLKFADYSVPFALSSNRGITVTAGGGTIELPVDGGSGAFSNIISGTGSVTFITNSSGNGKWVTISGSSTYDGVTTFDNNNAANFFFTSIGNINGGASSLGDPTTAANGRVILNGNSPQLGYVGTGVSITDRQFEWNLGGLGNFDADGAGALILNGNFLATGTNTSLSLAGYGIGIINGNILQTETAPTNFSKSGVGTWQLNGQNTYAGTTTVSAGVLEFSTIGNIGSGPSSLGAATATSGTIALSGGILRFVGDTAQSTDRALALNASSGLETTGSAPITFLSGVADTDTTTGTRVLTLGGTGDGFFSGAGIISNSATGKAALTMQGLTGEGTWTLNQTAANTYTGATTVNGGTLVLDFSNLSGATNLINNASALTLGGGTLSIVGNPMGQTSQTFASLSLSTNTGSVLSVNGNGGAGTTFTTTSQVWSLVANSTLDIETTGNVTIAGNPSLTNNLLDNVTYNGTSFATVSSGTLTAFTSYTGSLTASGGTKNDTRLLTGSLTLLGTSTLYALKIAPTGGAQSLDLNGFAINASGSSMATSILFDGTNNAYSIINSGDPTAKLGDSAQELIFSIAGTHALTVSAGLMNGTGSGAVVKTGTGTLILSGTNNTYVGQTDVERGTLQAGNDAGFSAASIFNVSGSGVLATGDFNPGVFYLAGNGTVENGSDNDHSLTIGASNIISNTSANASGTFTGIIEDGGAGSLSVVKAGYGQQNFYDAYNAMNTYTGSTSVLAGILSVNTVADSGVASSIGAGDTINLGSYGQLGTLQITQNLTANNETNRSIVLAAGGTGGIDVVGSSFPNTLPNGDMDGALLTLTGNISGDGTLLKLGTGNLDLRGTNTYTGGTVVSQGILRFGTASSVPKSGLITVNRGGTVGTGYAIDQNFLSQISAASTGVVALGADSSNDLDFNQPNLANVALGATGHFVFSGTLTANEASGYQLGGGGFNQIYGNPSTGPDSALFIANANTITGNHDVTISPHGSAGASVVFDDTQNFVGALTVIGGVNAAFISPTFYPNNGNAFGSAGSPWIAAADLTLAGGSQGTLTGVTSINLGPLGTLEMVATAQNVDRLPNGAPINFTGGTLAFLNDGSTASFSETVGQMNLISGESEVFTNSAVAGQTSVLTFSSLNHVAGATVTFDGPNLGMNAQNEIVIQGIGSSNLATPWATIGTAGLAPGLSDAPTDFAIISSTGSFGSVTAANGLAITSDGTLNGGDYTFATGNSMTLSTDRSANTILDKIGTYTLTIGAHTLAVNGIMNTMGNSIMTIGTLGDGGSLTSMAGTQEIVFNAATTGANPHGSDIIVNTNIVDNGASTPVSVVKTGMGDVFLNGTNSFSGGLVVDGLGEVVLGSINSFGSGDITLNSGSVQFAVTMGAGAIANNWIVTNDAVIETVNTSAVQLTGSITLSGTGTTLYWVAGSTAGNSINGTISGNGNISLQSGGGTLTISGTTNNTYTGLTSILGREDGASSTTVNLEKQKDVNGNNVNAISGNILLGVSTAAGTTSGPQQQEVLILDKDNVSGYSTDQIADSSVITFQGGNGYDAGVFRLNNQSETIGGVQSSSAGDGLIQNDATATGSSTLTLKTVAGSNYTFSGLVQDHDNSAPTAAGKLAISVTGSGTQTFTNANTYTGGTTISGSASFYANNTAGSATGTGTVSLGNGAVLGGTGTITSSFNAISGNMMVGMATAGDTNTTNILTMTATGTTTFSGANLTFNLSTTSTADTKLALGATPSVVFGAGNSLTFDLQGSGLIANGTQYTLITTTAGGSGQSGSVFSGLTLTGSVISNINLDFVSGSYNGTLVLVKDGTGWDIDVDITQAVPEPGTWALMFGGLAMLALYQRTRRKGN